MTLPTARSRLFELTAAAALCLVAASPSFADEPRNGELVSVDARYAFIPAGFDDNDETVLVVDGYLPSGCYRLTRPDVEIDQTQRAVRIVPKARYFDLPCVEARIPYHFDVKLGVLAAGTYSVSVGVGSHLIAKELAVAEATNAGPDDHLYAPVDDASISRSADGRGLDATISGRFTNSCMVFSDVRVEVHGDTVNLLPIIDVGSQDDCAAVEVPFKKTVPLPATITSGRRLLHVRSLNGQAVNVLFFKP